MYPVGQNLAMSATLPSQPVMKDPDQIANMAKSQWFDKEQKNGAYYGWMDMIHNFDLGDTSYVLYCSVEVHSIFFFSIIDFIFFDLVFIRSFSAHEVGHFTQFVRAKANKFGCAASSSLTTLQGRDWRATWLACNYSFGNLITRPVYEAGPPASGCKTGNNPNLPGLCSSAEQYASEG